jgi:hypothetical protein
LFWLDFGAIDINSVVTNFPQFGTDIYTFGIRILSGGRTLMAAGEYARKC